MICENGSGFAVPSQMIRIIMGLDFKESSLESNLLPPRRPSKTSAAVVTKLQGRFTVEVKANIVVVALHAITHIEIKIKYTRNSHGVRASLCAI